MYRRLQDEIKMDAKRNSDLTGGNQFSALLDARSSVSPSVSLKFTVLIMIFECSETMNMLNAVSLSSVTLVEPQVGQSRVEKPIPMIAISQESSVTKRLGANWKLIKESRSSSRKVIKSRQLSPSAGLAALLQILTMSMCLPRHRESRNI